MPKMTRSNQPTAPTSPTTGFLVVRQNGRYIETLDLRRDPVGRRDQPLHAPFETRSAADHFRDRIRRQQEPLPELE
jgi:hypothetical protein